jgi:hypothetical protein
MADLVTVTVVKWHTRGGMVQPVNHTYEVTPDEVENLVALGLVTVAGPATPAEAPATPTGVVDGHAYPTTQAAVPHTTVLTAADPTK